MVSDQKAIASTVAHVHGFRSATGPSPICAHQSISIPSILKLSHLKSLNKTQPFKPPKTQQVPSGQLISLIFTLTKWGDTKPFQTPTTKTPAVRPNQPLVIQQFAMEHHYSNQVTLGESSDYIVGHLQSFSTQLTCKKIRGWEHPWVSPLLHLRAGQNRLLVLGHGLLFLLQLIEPRLKVLAGCQDLLQLLTGDVTIPAKRALEMGTGGCLGKGFMRVSTWYE